MRKILDAFNPLNSCKKYGVSLWQCPQFLFLIMGLVIIAVLFATYFIAAFKISNPMAVSLIVISAGAVLMMIDFVVTRSFERLADASRMKTEFISVITHQLRSPLTNLRFSLEALADKKSDREDAKELEYFKILDENAEKMNDLIDNLLTLSRIESGSFPVKKEEVALDELARKLILRAKCFAEASNVKVVLEAERNLPRVKGSALWLEQVIENLLDNAIRYTKEKGEVKVRVQKKKNLLHFAVQDQGVGIPKEEQKYIFQKFFRARNALKAQTEGSGLGLHIAKRILEALGGKISFVSKEGKGTTFYFSLPIK